MKKKAMVFLVIASLICISCISSCRGKVTQPLPTISNGEIVTPQDFDHGVYYFNAIEETFGRSLAAFKAVHPELKVTAIGSNDSDGGYGQTIGYFVNCEEK